MKWLEIQVTTSQEAEEAVTGILYDLGAGGVVIKNPNDVKELAQTSEWDYFDPSLLEEGEEVKISAYFPITADITDKVTFLKERILELKSFGINVGNVKVEVSEVDEEDWADSWKQYYKPLKVGKRIVIRPLWEEYSPKEGEIVIDLDPGMAFGTGTHETTKMCLEFLEDIIKSGAVVFDVGCGSGILSIAASKLGASRVYGADVDEMAVKIARENVKLNGLENVEIFQSDLLKNFRGKADVIVANIIADAIIRLIPDVLPHLKEEGLFLASGIIKDRFEEVKERAEEFFEIIDLKEEKRVVEHIDEGKGIEMRKIFVEKGKIKGKFAYVDGKDFHHLIHVLRYKVGDKIVVSDMAEEHLGRIEKIEKDRVILFLEEKMEGNAESPLEVFLFQGILKADKMDLIVQKCTEIGVRRIIPFVSEFSVVDIKRANIDKKVERWKKISEEACKQSGRNIIPEIFVPVSFEETIEKAMECDLAIIPYEKEEKKRLKEVLKDVEDAKKIGIFIGPEGGFSQKEIEKAINNGIVPVTLGPRILRAETAAIAVSAIVMYQLGDMG